MEEMSARLGNNDLAVLRLLLAASLQALVKDLIIIKTETLLSGGKRHVVVRDAFNLSVEMIYLARFR
jgi:hypothetical protein